MGINHLFPVTVSSTVLAVVEGSVLATSMSIVLTNYGGGGGWGGEGGREEGQGGEARRERERERERER